MPNEAFIKAAEMLVTEILFLARIGIWHWLEDYAVDPAVFNVDGMAY